MLRYVIDPICCLVLVVACLMVWGVGKVLELEFRTGEINGV